MSKANDSLMTLLIRQVYLVSQHQDLAEKNYPNQLIELTEALNNIVTAIGNANYVEVASIDEEAIELLIDRTKLEANLEKDDSFT